MLALYAEVPVVCLQFGDLAGILCLKLNCINSAAANGAVFCSQLLNAQVGPAEFPGVFSSP